jgi:tRNA (guanine-N7-)-methyltransferase
MENFGKIRTFGRVKSRKLSKKKENLLQNSLPKYHYKKLEAENFHIFNLEIGSGDGEFIFQKAQKNPDQCFIACETHINSVANILAKLDNISLNNLFIFNGDVRDFITDTNLKFNNIFILNPDPWPKSKQKKRRLISDNFIKKIFEIMNSKAELIIVTDHDDYKLWIIDIILRKSKLFFWTAKQKTDWINFPSDWVWTKYQKKAILEGRNNVFLKILKK